MTVLASATGLEITINLLLGLFVLVCLLMSMIILMQRPKNEGLGAAFGSGATDQLFGAQTTNVLQKGTVYLGSLFFVLTITLAVLMTKRDHSGQSFVGKVEEAPVEAPKKEASILPEPEKQPLESKVATEPVKTPATGDTTPAPESAPTPATGDKPPGEAAPATPPAPPASEEKPAEPAKPEGEEKAPGNP